MRPSRPLYRNTAEYARYATQPMPDSWYALLTPLTAAEASPPTAGTVVGTTLPDLGRLFDTLLGPLPDRERNVLHGRLGRQRILKEIGDELGVTRERVRQLQRNTVASVLHGQRERLETLEAWCLEHGHDQLRHAPCRSALLSDADDASVLRTVMQLCAELTPNDPDRRAPWLMTMHAPPALMLHQQRQVQGYLRRGAHFSLTRDAERHAGCLPGSLNHTPNLPGAVYRTRDGRLALQNWTTVQWCVAVARELAQHGHKEWHYSQMTAALRIVAPTVFQDLPAPLLLSALLSKNGRMHTEFAGRAGVYRLREHGDGHHTNLAAVQALIRTAGRPMSFAEIRLRLQRDLKPVTLHMILKRPGFTACGHGLYDLDTDLPRTPAEQLLRRLAGTHATLTLPADLVHTEALKADLQPTAVMHEGQTSRHYRYRPARMTYTLTHSESTRRNRNGHPETGRVTTGHPDRLTAQSRASFNAVHRAARPRTRSLRARQDTGKNCQ